MSVSIREQILAAMTSAVGGVYSLDAPEDDRDLPFTALLDDGETAEPEYGTTAITMPVTVARAESADSQKRDDMRAQCNAILAALITEVSGDAALNLLIDGADYTGGLIQAVGDVCVAQADFNVRYRTLAGDPYNSEED